MKLLIPRVQLVYSKCFVNLEARADLRRMRDTLQTPSRRTSHESYTNTTKSYPAALKLWKEFLRDELPGINARDVNCRVNWSSDQEGGNLRNPAYKKDAISRILSCRKEVAKSNNVPAESK